jgi:hypothetical protein
MSTSRDRPYREHCGENDSRLEDLKLAHDGFTVSLQYVVHLPGREFEYRGRCGSSAGHTCRISVRPLLTWNAA